MIFIAKNELGKLSWQSVLDDEKTVTRRLKPLPGDKVFAVQPGRGKFAVCRCRVISCIRHEHWARSSCNFGKEEEEAHKEGFLTWKGLLDWLEAHGIDIDDTWRIEFEKWRFVSCTA